jgi:hypothetical protein
MEGANHRQRIHTAIGLVELSNGRPRNFSKPDEQSTNVAIFKKGIIITIAKMPNLHSLCTDKMYEYTKNAHN